MNGHPRFYALTAKENELHDKKNHDYASGGDPLGNFKRVALILGQYPGLDLSDPTVVALVFAMKQIDATLWGLCKKIEHKVEGITARMQDISVYTKLAQVLYEEGQWAGAQPLSHPTDKDGFHL
jgi:hypothetical protein